METSTKMRDHNQERALLEETRTYARQLEQVNAIGRELSAMLELEPLLHRILRAAIELTSTEEGAFFLVEETSNDLVFSVVDGGPQELVGRRLPAGTGIVGKVAATGEPLIVNDVQENRYWSDAIDKSRGFTTRSILAVPLLKKDQCTGVLEVINRKDGQPFRQQDLIGMTALALQAVVAMETARLHQAELAKQRMEQELQLGHTMQSSLIPTTVPTIADWEFATWWQPAREVSGDFYDFVRLDGNLGLVLGDVSDKGVHAALFMALARSTVRTILHVLRKPAVSITEANKLIAQDAERGMFVTLFYAQFRPASGEVLYVNAGHNPPYWYRAAQREIVELEPTGIFLGFEAGIPFEQKAIRCAPGDSIVFYTDGVTEAMDADRTQFGDRRLRTILRKSHTLSPGEILESIKQILSEHIGDESHSDDITVVIAKRK